MAFSRSAVQIFYIFLGALACFVYGIDYGYLSGVLSEPVFIERFGAWNSATGSYELKSDRLSLLSSTIYVGSFAGALISPILAKNWGNKWSLIFGCLSFAFGSALQLGAVNINMFIAGRAISGLLISFANVLGPAYVNEIAPKHLRGTGVVMCLQLLTFGNFTSSMATLGAAQRSDKLAYQLPISLCIMVSGVCAVALLLMPQTPVHLAARGRWDDAQRVIARVWHIAVDEPEVEQEIVCIRESLGNHQSDDSKWIELFQQPNLRRTIYSAANIILMNAFTGINFYLTYGSVFAAQAGFSSPWGVTALLAGVNCFTTTPALWLVERFGRRPLKFVGGAGSVIFSLMAAVAYSASPDGATSQRLLIAGVTLSVFFFAGFIGPAGWAYTAEIPTARLRAKTIGFANASYVVFVWAFGYASPYLFQDPVNLKGAFCYIWLGGNVLCSIFDYFCLYETVGLAHHEIDKMMASGVSARLSAQWGRDKKASRGDLTELRLEEESLDEEKKPATVVVSTYINDP